MLLLIIYVKEVEAKNYRELIQEIIDLKEMSFDKFKKIKKEKSRVNFKQPKTGINVDVRHQYTPNQLISFLNKYGFVVKKYFYKSARVWKVNY